MLGPALAGSVVLAQLFIFLGRCRKKFNWVDWKWWCSF